MLVGSHAGNEIMKPFNILLIGGSGRSGTTILSKIMSMHPDISTVPELRYLIDPDGIIQGYEVLTPPVGRNVNETFRQVQAFQLVRASKGTEATPSGWKPGKMTLKPGPELVGNVWKDWKTEMAFD